MMASQANEAHKSNDHKRSLKGKRHAWLASNIRVLPHTLVLIQNRSLQH